MRFLEIVFSTEFSSLVGNVFEDSADFAQASFRGFKGWNLSLRVDLDKFRVFDLRPAVSDFFTFETSQIGGYVASRDSESTDSSVNFLK